MAELSHLTTSMTVYINTQLPGMVSRNAIILTAGISLNESRTPPKSLTNVLRTTAVRSNYLDFVDPVFSAFFTYVTTLTLTASTTRTPSSGRLSPRPLITSLSRVILEATPMSLQFNPFRITKVPFRVTWPDLPFTMDGRTLSSLHYDAGTSSICQVLVGASCLALMKRNFLLKQNS